MVGWAAVCGWVGGRVWVVVGVFGYLVCECVRVCMCVSVSESRALKSTPRVAWRKHVCWVCL